MKAFLMYRDRDFDMQGKIPINSPEFVNDLEVETLWEAMASGDKFLLQVAEKSMLTSLKQPDDILYRQRVLTDCLERSAVVREMYLIATEAIEREKKVWGSIFGRYPEGLLTRSVEVLAIFVGLLKRLRSIADLQRSGFHSEGFTRFFDMISNELDDDYLRTVDEHLRRLSFKESGILMSAELGRGNQGTNYILRKPRDAKHGWRERLRQWFERLAPGDRSRFVYEVDGRDEAGHRALSELKGRGISQVASALAQSTDHILSFFTMLRTELGFYIGCLNLRELLVGKGEPICLPAPMKSESVDLSAQGLYDVCLSLRISERVVGNDVNADGKSLVMITGANRGGKSTFLRSVGLAQLMMQCGMFSPAQSFRANICVGVYTHFKREEDTGMRSGKLDEELNRMSVTVDYVTPNSMVLLNESFGSTNEREGSEIARQIVTAMLDSGVKVLYVTHMFDLAIGFYRTMTSNALFLRAERLSDGVRTFRLLESEPLPTSYGEDLYRRIFAVTEDIATADALDSLQERE